MRTPARRTRLPRVEAFTLVELLVVIAILGILTALATSALMGAKCSAKEAIAQTTVQDLSSKIHAYDADHARFPAEMTGGSNAHKNQLLVFALGRPAGRGTPYYEFRRDLQGNLTGGPPAQFVSELVASGNNDPTAYPCYYSPLVQRGSPSSADLHMYYYRENRSEASKAGLYNPHSFDLWTSGCVQTATGPDDDTRYGGRTHPENARVNNWR